MALHCRDVEPPPARLGEVGQDLDAPISVLLSEAGERGLEFAPRVRPHRHADEGVATPGVQLGEQVAAVQALRERDRPLVVGGRVASRQEPHRLVAGRDAVAQRRFVEPGGQGVAGQLRGGRGGRSKASKARRWKTRRRASPASV